MSTLEIQELHQALERARAQLADQKEFIDKMMEAPSPYATVLKVMKKRVVLSGVGGAVMEVARPSDKEVKPGFMVRVNAQSMQILDIVEGLDLGNLCTVSSVTDDGQAEVEVQGSQRVVDCSRIGKTETGDRIIVDANGFVALKNLGKNDRRFEVRDSVETTWDDVGGLAEAKKTLIEAVELPFKYPKLYKGYGQSQVKGVLLHGPPGCGKTLLAKAVATSLAKIHGADHSTGFIYIKGPEILSKWVGQSEATIRSLFARARKHKEQHGYPAVLFIDEADAVLSKRGQGQGSHMTHTIVPQFLSEMDGFDESSAVVLLSTNRASDLDSAVVRDGRIDRKVHVPRPTEDSAFDIFCIHLRGRALHKSFSQEEIAEAGAKALYGEDYPLYEVRTTEGETHTFGLRHIVNGAMVRGIVSQACSNALHRDLEDGASKPSGILEDDLLLAIESVRNQNRGLDHDEALQDFVSGLGGGVESVQAL